MPLKTLYVDKGCPGGTAGADGSAARPFCTISAAAAVVSPGQTVIVEPGNYSETVTISRSGTAAAPITFVAGNTWYGQVRVGAVLTQMTGPIITVQDAQHVVIRGFIAWASSGNAFLVTNSTDITVDQGAASTLDAPDVLVTGTSNHVTVSRASLRGFAPNIQIDPGISGTVVSTNTVLTGRGTGPAILATDAPNTAITSNTVQTSCSGVGLTGASTGAVVENNILVAGTSLRPCPGPPVAVSVSTGSAPQTVVAYNLIKPQSGLTPYGWADSTYPDPATFTAGTGQGAHDIVADPQLLTARGGNIEWLPIASTSPAVDSADATAPGELTTDQVTMPHADDPTVPNTGTGVGYADRGAVEEYGGGFTYSCGTMTTAPGGRPQDVIVTDTMPASWTTDGPAGTFLYQFDDARYPITARPGTVEHHFTTPGPHSVQVTVSPDAFLIMDGYSCTNRITLDPDYHRRLPPPTPIAR